VKDRQKKIALCAQLTLICIFDDTHSELPMQLTVIVKLGGSYQTQQTGLVHLACLSAIIVLIIQHIVNHVQQLRFEWQMEFVHLIVHMDIKL